MKTIIFDFDGTLTKKSNEIWRNIWIKLDALDVDDELYGVTVTIKHSNEVYSIYSSLSDVSLKVNDSISKGEVIGKASTSVEDIDAGVHVHLEILVNGNYTTCLAFMD